MVSSKSNHAIVMQVYPWYAVGIHILDTAVCRLKVRPFSQHTVELQVLLDLEEIQPRNVVKFTAACMHNMHVCTC